MKLIHDNEVQSCCRPVRLGMTGIEGYASALISILLRERAKSHPPNPLQLAAVTAPDFTGHEPRLAELKRLGITAMPSFDDMLGDPSIDAVWLPLPIHLHLPFAEQALHAGKAVMCEKPITATIDECDRLIAACDRANGVLAVGFGMIYDPTSLFIKRQLQRGVIGRIERVTILGCWPRGYRYYRRSSWPGRIRIRNAWVLDSPIHNAMAHYVNLSLYWLGAEEQQAAEPHHVEAELYRVNEVENFDTCCIRYQVDHADKPHMLVCMTHACDSAPEARITVYGERGLLIWTREHGGDFFLHDGSTQHVPREDQNEHMTRSFAHFVRGDISPDRPVGTAEIARPQVIAANGANQAGRITDVPRSFIRRTHDPDEGEMLAIPHLHKVFQTCLERDQMLSESGLAPWAAEPGRLNLRGYSHFDGDHLLPAIRNHNQNATTAIR